MGPKAREVDGSNREYVQYDQVDKPQTYRFAEASDQSEAFDDDFVVRTCDLSLARGTAAEQAELAETLGAALREIGFAILVDTGVDPAIYQEAEAATFRLFEDCELEEKLRYRAARHGSVNQGYFPIRETSDIHPDLVEGWVFCRRAFALDLSAPPRLRDFWPSDDFEPIFRRLCLAHEALVLPVMAALLGALGQDPSSFDERLMAPSFGLRLNYYPPLSESDDASGAGRLLGHEDVNLFTLLPAPRVEGLQVLNRKNAKWVRLDAPPGALVLNTGDYMQRISNDVFPSTTHRVSKPFDPEIGRQRRATFPLNVYLREQEVLEVLPGLGEPRYPPVKAITFHTRSTSKFYGDDYAVHD